MAVEETPVSSFLKKAMVDEEKVTAKEGALLRGDEIPSSIADFTHLAKAEERSTDLMNRVLSLPKNSDERLVAFTEWRISVGAKVSDEEMEEVNNIKLSKSRKGLTGRRGMTKRMPNIVKIDCIEDRIMAPRWGVCTFLDKEGFTYEHRGVAIVKLAPEIGNSRKSNNRMLSIQLQEPTLLLRVGDNIVDDILPTGLVGRVKLLAPGAADAISTYRKAMQAMKETGD